MWAQRVVDHTREYLRVGVCAYFGTSMFGRENVFASYQTKKNQQKTSLAPVVHNMQYVIKFKEHHRKAAVMMQCKKKQKKNTLVPSSASSSSVGEASRPLPSLLLSASLWRLTTSYTASLWPALSGICCTQTHRNLCTIAWIIKRNGRHSYGTIRWFS